MLKKFDVTLRDGLTDPDTAFAVRLAEFLWDDESDNVTRTMIFLYQLNAIILCESEGDRKAPEEYLELIIAKMREMFPPCKKRYYEKYARS